MQKYYAIGLMSGTSLDGLDICYAKFTKENNWDFEIIHAETISYSKEWFEKLKNAIHLKSEDLLALNVEYGNYLGNEILKFRERNTIQKIDIIASHGHTVFHQPNRKFTLQIGDGRAIKLKNNFPIAYDFRSQDVILGGNGAPLVPIGDELLFNEYQACLNLGGFSNISFHENKKRIAFDICPVNTVLNYYAKQLGFEYDKNGKMAQQGTINQKVLKQLNQLNYYHQQPPKSLGIEWVINHIFHLLDELLPKDAIATFTHHIAEQICTVFKNHSIKNCLITGGGTFNSYLIQQLEKNHSTNIIIPNTTIIDFKEALVFAFMGVLRLRNENNILSSTTGSMKDSSSGILI